MNTPFRYAGKAWQCLYTVFCACVLAFPAVWFVSEDAASYLVRVGLILFIVILCGNVRRLGSDAAVWLGLASFLVLLAGYVWQINTISEELFGGSLARRYFVVFFFSVLVAYATVLWRPLSPFLILICAALGGMFFLSVHAPTEDWFRAWSGHRVAYGFWNAQHAGVFFGTGLLAASFFALRLSRSFEGWLRLLCVLALLGFLALMVWGTVTTQVRAVWLGLLVSVGVLAALAFLSWGLYRGDKKGEGRSRALWWLCGLGVVLAAVLLAVDADDRVRDRLAGENISLDSLREAAQFEQEDRLTSSGVRVASWAASIDWIAERPYLGWGRHTVKGLIAADERFDEQFKQRFGHIHNSYLEALIAVGFLGVLPWVGLIGLIGWRSVQAWRDGVMPTDAFLFSWAFFFYWLVVNLFESYVNSGTGLYMNSVIGGFVYAFHLRRQTSSRALESASAP